MNPSPFARFLIFVLSLGGLALAATSGVGLTVWLSQADGSLRYPEAARVSSLHYGLRSLPEGYVTQYGVYHTDRDVMDVWRWYARRFGVSPNSGLGAPGNCMELTRTDDQGVLREWLVVLICPNSRGTMIIVNRSVGVGR